VWGVNAVNGVINIVTKSATDTHGVYADSGAGQNGHRQFGDFRLGGQSNDLHWRMYGMGMQDDPSIAPNGLDARDEPSMAQGGFRADWTPSRRDTVTFQGDFYRGISNQDGYTVFAPAHTMRCSTSTILTRWARTLDEDTDWALQLYYWDPYACGYNINSVSTFDLDYQYHLNRGRHDIVWGFGYRNYDERWVGGGTVLAPQDSEQIPSYFVQDTITLVNDRLFATFGSKFDHNSVTDFEYQPTARVTWTPNEKTSVWGAISRASRVPSLIERIYTTPQAEHVLAYEFGVRRQPTERFFWELATFFNRYNDLLTYEQQRVYRNHGSADTYGFEWNGTYTLTERWHLTAWYAFLVQDVDLPIGWTSNFYPGAYPRNEAYFQSGWDLGRNVSLDVMFRYVDALVNAPYFTVDDYFAADIRLAWRPTTHMEMALVGQNLLCGNHREYTYDAGCWPTEVQPAVYGVVSWRY
jgi:iron complex outermembrane recepter protein